MLEIEFKRIVLERGGDHDHPLLRSDLDLGQAGGRTGYSHEDIEDCKSLLTDWFREQDNLGPPAIAG